MPPELNGLESGPNLAVARKKTVETVSGAGVHLDTGLKPGVNETRQNSALPLSSPRVPIPCVD